MIRLVNILKAQGVALGRYKIHLATPGKTSPLTAYWQGRFKEWQEKQNAKNFECETVIGLIRLNDLNDDQWLFAGAYRILNVEGAKPNIRYKTELLPGQTELVGRIVVRYKRGFRASYILGDKYGSQLEVVKLLELPLDMEDFKGYKDVWLSHETLKVIVQRSAEPWRSTLSRACY
jgi:hypothetical protein